MTLSLQIDHAPAHLEPPAAVAHTGKPLPAGRQFYAPAPTDIGKILSAHSTLKTGRTPFSPLTRAAFIAAALAPGVAVMFYRNPRIIAEGREEWIPWMILGITWILLALPIAFLLTRLKVTCSYVGERGAARYISTGPTSAKPREEKILFDPATALFVTSVRYRVGTVYKYQWIDSSRRILCTLKGKFTSSIGMSPDDDVHFVRAAERAWSHFALARADAELAADGHLRFLLGGDHYVLISPGSISFHFGKEHHICTARDIKSMSIRNGSFSIVHRDAAWYSMKGRFTFPYAAMPNAQLFCMALERFLPRSTWAATNGAADPDLSSETEPFRDEATVGL